MELTTDVLLRGPQWARVIDSLENIFKTRTNYSIFKLCTAIGIMYDQRIEKFEDGEEEPRNVPRNVIQNNDNGNLDFMFRAAILSTTTEQFTEEERLELAFGDKQTIPFNKIQFLASFANYGMTKLEELIGEDNIESMENIKNFLVNTVSGNNYDIDSLPDDLLLEGDEF